MKLSIENFILIYKLASVHIRNKSQGDNEKKINLLVYFTDGKGENKLRVLPKGYKILWVISGRGDKLSLKEPYGAVKKLSKVKIKEDGKMLWTVTWLS